MGIEDRGKDQDCVKREGELWVWRWGWKLWMGGRDGEGTGGREFRRVD
jgi:hypothetical protein